MKTKLAQASENAIKRLRYEPIEKILRDALNPQSLTFASLFRRDLSDDFTTPTVFEDCNPLIIAFQYGTTDLTQALFRALRSLAPDALFSILLGDAERRYWPFRKAGEDMNLLHVLFAMSKTMVQQAIDLLALLPEDKIYTLLSKSSQVVKAEPAKTALMVLCDRLDQEPSLAPEMTRLIQLVSRYPLTQALLVPPEKSKVPLYPIKRIVQADQVTCVSHFLSYALKTPIYHAKVEDLLYVARYHGFKKMSRLIEAYFYLRRLHAPRYFSHHHVYLGDIHPQLLHETFASGQTLLHEALYLKNTTLAKQLIEKQSPVLIADNSGKTAFNLAIEYRWFDVLSLMIKYHPEVCLMEGLGQLLSLGEMLLGMEALSVLDRFNMNQVSDALHRALTYDFFGKETLSLVEAWKKEVAPVDWKQFAQDNQDMALVFFVTIAAWIKKKDFLSYASVWTAFFERILVTEKASVSVRILGLFCRLGCIPWLDWLSQLALPAVLEGTLKNILFQGLFKPFIFYALTKEEDARLAAYLSEPPYDFESLIIFHFKHSILLSIVDERLLALAEMLPVAQRQQILKETQDVILSCLWLSNTSTLAWLITRLAVLDLEVLAKALHLVRRFNNDFFEGLCDSPIVYQRFQAAFNQTEKFGAIDKSSLLARLFLHIACHHPEHCHPNQLKAYFSAVSVEESESIFYHFHQRLLEETIWVADIDCSVLSGVLLNPDKEIIFPQWMRWELASLPYKTESALLSQRLLDFPVFSIQTGKKVMQQGLDALLFAVDERLVHLLETMAYIAEWYGEAFAEMENKLLARLKGFQCILSDYPTALDVSFFTHFVNELVKTNRIDLLFAGYPVIAGMLSQSAYKINQYWWSALSEEAQASLLKGVLSGLTSTALEVQLACQAILQWILDNGRHDKTYVMVQKQLGAQDFALLLPQQLTHMAMSVVKQPQDEMGMVYQGVWIQRLLTSPLFISQCGLSTLTHIIERYHAFSITLKQAEYSCLHQALKNCRFDARYRTALEKAMIESHFKDRLKRLLQFRTDDGIRALMLELESQCLTWPDRVEAKQALTTLYQHYHDRFKTVRMDGLFRFTNFLYHWLFKHAGDLTFSKNKLYQWVKMHLPHDCAYQEALVAVTQAIELRNEKNEVVGYIDSSHYAVSCDAVRLSQHLPGRSLFYDKQGRIIGHLTEEGLFESEALLQKGTAARLLMAMPLTALKESEPCVALLMAQVCLDSTLSVLFHGDLEPEKTHFFETVCIAYVRSSPYDLPRDTWLQLSQCLSVAAVLQLLLSGKLKTKAFLSLIEAVILSNRFWTQWVGEIATQIATILCEKDTKDSYLMQYLSTYQQEPWFIEGLKCLLAVRGLMRLTLALEKMDNVSARHPESGRDEGSPEDGIVLDIGDPSSGEAAFRMTRGVTRMLLTHEPVTRMWLAWMEALPKRKEKWKKRFLRYFNKQDVVQACKIVNQSGQLFLIHPLLMLFKSEQSRLFRKHEMRLNQESFWQAEDLKQLLGFLTHPAVQQRSESTALIAEYVLRAANFALCDGFYAEDKTTLNFNWLHKKLPVSDFLILSHPVQDLQYEAGYQALLQEDKLATIDWQKMAQAMLSRITDNNHCDLLHVFLFNYAGSKQPLSYLLRDICANIGYGYEGSQLTKFIALCPEHPVVPVIREVLYGYLMGHPGVLTETMLGHLLTPSGKTTVSALGLIERFGHQKQYRLVDRICTLLAQQSPSLVERKLLSDIYKEARLEACLLKQINRWYFGPYAFLKRLWHYGWQAMHHPTGVVIFAEKPAIPVVVEAIPETIVQWEVSGETVSNALSQQAKRGKIIQLKAHLERSKAKTSLSIQFFGNQNHPHSPQEGIHDKNCPDSKMSIQEAGQRSACKNA